MDHGHYNCRDYYITPHFAPTTLISERNPLYRHESFEELEQRSRSPASQKPKFPLLKLPLELRQQIFKYLLPYTREKYEDSSLLSSHARNFSAVKKREAKGMFVPSTPRQSTSTPSTSNVVWQRGNTTLLSVCRQLHRECAEMLYGTNTFLLFVTYQEVKFRFRWVLPSGLAPSRSFEILKVMPRKYLQFLKRVIVNVDHVDPYTGMIKFNVQGKGLAAGLTEKVWSLVDALREYEGDGSRDMPQELVVSGERRLTRVNIRVNNGNAVVDALKNEGSRERQGDGRIVEKAKSTFTIENAISGPVKNGSFRQHEIYGRINEDVKSMLEPFGWLRGVREVGVAGAVTPDFAQCLAAKMQSEMPPEDLSNQKFFEKRLAALRLDTPPLCVYGNDMT